jgi:hypothetical protein
LGLAFVGIVAGPDVDEPVHEGERKTNGAPGQGLIVMRSGAAVVRPKKLLESARQFSHIRGGAQTRDVRRSECPSMRELAKVQFAS